MFFQKKKKLGFGARKTQLFLGSATDIAIANRNNHCDFWVHQEFWPYSVEFLFIALLSVCGGVEVPGKGSDDLGPWRQPAKMQSLVARVEVAASKVRFSLVLRCQMMEVFVSQMALQRCNLAN